ncbi:protoporphyrinogen/coproporphyrinogen oxidase [Cellulomonas sp.]|uniref:protoporphyrinogen/coproporphyrinogen oxidase n=1 Tax=Cellulomonas sp. TaxID=40001 RepID=UPI002D75B6A2|nr:FAD-dependent oxidoreductase [Cellulomonas sp.]HYQ74317.1 FAD-dependent oxidoreductase [Cellulomonas sp.]
MRKDAITDDQDRAAGTTRDPEAAPPGGAWDAVVVGGGVAGLVAARELALAGLRPLVLEAWRSPGGVVGRHEVDGLALDAGAESFATRGGVVAALAEELGLADRVVTPEKHGAWVRLPGGAGPLPRTGLLGIPADPWAPDVRRTIGLAGSLRAALDRLLPARVGTADGTTLGALVRARAGRRVLDRLVRPVVAGVHAAEPDDVAADAVAPGLVAAVRREGSLARGVAAQRALAPAGSAVAGFRGGLHVLVEALVADVVARGGSVRTGASVRAVARAGDGFAVTVDGPAGPAGSDGPGAATLTTPRLVVATPGAVDLLAGVAPGLAGLATDPGADIVLATLVLDAPELDAAPRGTGVLVARGVAGVRAKALTHATAKWAWLAEAAGPGRHVVRLSYGRAGDDAGAGDGVPRDLDALTDLAVRDAAAVLGVPLRREQVRASARVRWRQGLPVPSAAHRETVRRVRDAVAAVPGLAVVGAWVSGNGLASVVPDARATASALAAAAPPGAPAGAPDPARTPPPEA